MARSLDLLDLLILLAVAAAAMGAVMFCARFHFTTRGAWRRTAIGRNLMLFTGMVATAELITLSRVLGDWPWRRPALLAVFVLFAALSWQRWLLLEREQRATPKGQTMVGGNPATRPVVIFTAITVGLQTLLGAAGIGDLLDARLLAWLLVANAVLTAVGGVLTSNSTTSLADPRDERGRPLMTRASAQAYDDPGVQRGRRDEPYL